MVKELAGGNAEDGKHHPGAAGLLWLELQAADIDADFLLALSGACATIASDALMNPFDGKNTHACPWAVTDLVKSSNSACKYTAPPTLRSRNVLAPFTAPKGFLHSTSPTPRHYA